jgi:hypothetical protein
MQDLKIRWCPRGIPSRGALEKFTKGLKITAGTLIFLSANILTNLNKNCPKINMIQA